MSSSPRYSTLIGRRKSDSRNASTGSDRVNSWFSQLTKARAAEAPREKPYTYNLIPSSLTCPGCGWVKAMRSGFSRAQSCLLSSRLRVA
ncbi:hypothetical protein D9M71_839150 [compost metagenome]